MRARLLCAGAAAWVAVALPAQAASIGDDPAGNLIRAAAASRTTTYEGVMVYRGDNGDRFEVLRVQHRYQDGSERERLVALTGEPRQLLRIDNKLICILPKDQMVSLARPGLRGFLTQLNADRVQMLGHWYDFRDLGLGRIAGRMCNGVAVLPRDEYRYGFEVWADRDTGLPLKISLVGSRGEVLEQVMFTDISFPASIPDSVFTAAVDSSKFKAVAQDLPTLDTGTTPPGKPQVSFDQLPPGYHVVAHEDRPLSNGQPGQMEQLLLSDGLSAVSVFSEIEQHAAPDKLFRGVSHLGPVQAYGRVIGSYHITIVGEVPPQAIRMIGDGAHPVLPLPTAPAESATP